MSVRVTRNKPNKKPTETSISEEGWERIVIRLIRNGAVGMDLLPNGTMRIRISREAASEMAPDAKRMGISVEEMLQRKFDEICQTTSAGRRGDL